MTEQNRETIADNAGIDEIKEEFEGKPDPVEFHANRVPREISSHIKDLADDKFAGDYGMALTFLVEREDVRSEMLALFQQMQQRIEKLEQQLNTLINEAEKDEDEGLDTLG